MQALNNVCEIPSSQLPQPLVKGDRLSITIQEYIAGIYRCKNNFHGRIIYPKGATPLAVFNLRAKLAPLWKDLGSWGVIS